MSLSLEKATLPVLLLAAACATAPYTGRSQLMMVSQSEELTMGVQAYKEALSKASVVHDAAVTARVRAVGERIAKAADKPEYQWEFTVIDDPKQANAFALPGGKVAVYTGLFPIAHDDAGLAAVLGHEVGHAIARHGAERVSQAMSAQAVGTALSVGVGAVAPGASSAVMAAYGLGSQVGVLLPWSRTQEAEADHIGLILMAKAGYDPHAALDLWQRFAQAEKQQPPEFLSTHPGYGTRQQNIASWIPEAERYYQADPSVQVSPLPAIASAH